MILPLLALLGSVATVGTTIVASRRNRQRMARSRADAPREQPQQKLQQQAVQPVATEQFEQPVRQAGFAPGEPAPSPRVAINDTPAVPSFTPVHPLDGQVLVPGDPRRKLIPGDIILHPLDASM